ncbi:MAG: transcription-repair coupling factor [Ignavibacteria bacterium]|jgi:transcription-repair coupling factor (superfamily II helicase)|nr:transcription-repair coupling factor [Ignavibacteria bacterium]
MDNTHVLNIFKNLRFVKQSVALVNTTEDSFGAKMLFGSAKSLYIASLYAMTQKHYIVLAPSNEVAADYIDDLALLLPNAAVFLLNAYHKQSNIKLGNDTFLAELIDSIARFKSAEHSIAVATPDVFNNIIPNANAIQHHFCTLRKKQILDIQQFTTQLSLNGFQKEQYVSRSGEYAVRGGIIDIFAPNMQDPVRVELWDDEIDSIRFFDTLSQRSKVEMEQVDFIDSIFVNEKEETGTSIFEYLAQANEQCIFIIDSPESIDFTKQYLEPIGDYRKININPLGNVAVNITCTPQPNMHSSVQRLAMEMQRNISLGIPVFIAADGDIHLYRIQDLVQDLAEEDTNVNDAVQWLNASLSTGFYMLDDKLAYFVENEVFQRTRNSKKDKVNVAKGITLRELKQLNIGDLIVHEDKGIGKFDGFKSIEMGGSKQDCLKMIFADNDVLYVHLNYLHKVQKYSAADGVVPRLSKLGSTEWLRKKDRTKRKLKDIARDLIQLYAKRKMQKGFAFPTDTTWQKEFEASFIYEDTIDQARTTIEVKRDMESENPMDRLVCGDVGFGKTEIAIRAAFKAASAGKQTAVLVPTTILAQQHYQSFTERINRYPIKVDTISRFRSKTEQKEIIQNLKENKIDILIGTHRLLSKDIEFKNLGLLVIDEEHRFGVGAKEKLRQLKANVDTLTLTATPIPRTLNFSLMGARDLSQMETPPRNRLAVETEISDWSIELVTKIVLREIKRGGQCFIVNDKILGLDKMLMDLQMAMPSVRLAEIHGQMPPAHIEDVMAKFIEKKYDVLLSTKIIESGIDIPNANTIIINNSQNFGLAELYQLRGRVGRSTIQAYCYLLIPSINHLATNSLRRLLAIEEFSDLGSGLQLAMRDLEIRGSGDLLGAEQSGFISEIGFDLYQKVLEEAVMELKHDEFGDIFKDENASSMPKFDNDEINIETDTDAYFPPDYIADDTERFNYYKALYDAKSNVELKDLVKELEDRFGKLPPLAQELVYVVRLRIAALNTGFTRIHLRPNELVIEFPNGDNRDYYEKVFPIVLDTLQLYDDMNLEQHKDKLLVRKRFTDADNIANSRDLAIDFIWKVKKTIELNF